MSNDLTEIKERIYDEDKIIFLLEELDCEYVKDVGERVEAQLPSKFNSNNKRAVQIYKTESLNGYVRNKGMSGDIFVIVAYILYEAEDFEQATKHLYQCKTWVCNTLGWDEYLGKDGDFSQEVEKVDYLAFLRPVQKKRKERERREKLGYKENKPISESVVDRYFPYAHYSFYKDGIHPKTQQFFGVMFDRESERVVYPMHNRDGELIGVKGRYIGKNQRILDEIKYLFLHRCDKSIELWNYHRALEHIKRVGEVIVFESAKSVMLAWQWGFKNCVSIEGSEISPVQAMLLKQLDVTIVFAFDKDIEQDHILKQTRQIKSRVTKAVYDKENLLEEKDSPVDKGKETWTHLYTNNKYSIK